MKRHMALAASLCLVLQACTVGPDYERTPNLGNLGEWLGLGEETNTPFQNASQNASQNTDQNAASAVQTMSHWWERLGDPDLAPLVDEMLANNKDLGAAAARMRQAEAQLDASGGTRWPSLSLSPTTSRGFTSTPSGDRNYANSFSVGSTLSWQTDLFGRLARAERADAANLEAATADWQGLIHSQIATLVRTRVALATLEQRLAATRAIADSRQATLAAVERRYRAGLETTNAVDLHSARENYTSALADILALEDDLATTATGLDLLLGRLPGSTSYENRQLAHVPPPRDVPLGVPATLLDRRPDLRAAEFRLIAANENIGVAIADLYPNLTLTGSFSSTAATASNLFSAPTLAGSLAASIAQTVFDGGTKSATIRLRKAATEERTAIYADTILTAIKEVEDALMTERKSGDRLIQLERTVDQVRKAEASARDRFTRGIGTYERLLETQRRLQTVEQTLLIEQQNKWNARVNLLLALGGDWTDLEEKTQPEGTNP
ncbi:MAG: efflux transporter outer membrane subunit [Parvibaculaceae bacterium]|nr:efflux transporter outer membrane subunit [Parvibaculaceae bacterium]